MNTLAILGAREITAQRVAKFLVRQYGLTESRAASHCSAEAESLRNWSSLGLDVEAAGALLARQLGLEPLTAIDLPSTDSESDDETDDTDYESE